MTDTTLIVTVVNETDARREREGVIGEGTIMYTIHDQSELLLQCDRDVRTNALRFDI